MTTVDTSKLNGVPETLLIPLMGRALESQKSEGILTDPKSVAIFERLDYDFKKFEDDHSQRSFLRTTIRTAIIDRLLQAFLKDYPSTTVIEIGCGLNTRFERLDNEKVRWFDLDVSEVYEVWQKFFTETDRRTFLPFSAFDKTWLRRVKEESEGPYFFISEASVIYFPEEMIRQLFSSLHNHFPQSHYLFDSATPDFLESLKDNKDALKYCSVRLQWTIEDTVLLKNWIPGIELIKTVNLENPDPEFASLYPAGFRGDADGYQLNIVRL